MSTWSSHPRDTMDPNARHASRALGVGVAIVVLVGGVVSGQGARVPPAGTPAAPAQPPAQKAVQDGKPFDEFPDEFTYSNDNTHPEKRGITYRGKAPAGRPTKPWTGKFLPDGQPDVAKIWLPVASVQYWDRAVRGVGATKVADPPDGKVPYQPWALELVKTAGYDALNPTRPWDIDPRSRCVTSIPHIYAYAQPYKIYQPPGYVVFTFATFRFRRIIPLDGRPHLGSTIKLWAGDSIGHWDGNTLVVDTTNLNGYTARLDYMGGDFFSSHAHLTEKFIFEPADGTTMVYEATIDDPTVFTRPWTSRVIQTQKLGPDNEIAANGEFWEYQCGAGEETGTRPSSAPGTQPQ
jgi:hypothetical protein